MNQIYWYVSLYINLSGKTSWNVKQINLETFELSFWQIKSKKKAALLKGGQNIKLGESISQSPPEKLSWSTWEFFLQEEFVRLWEEKRQITVNVRKKKDDKFVTGLSSRCTSYLTFLPSQFPLSNGD